jgi:hypothetical protein
LELPNREQAFVQSAKLTTYLLSISHSIGQSKAKFFRGLGFNEETIPLLEQELLTIARTQQVIETTSTIHGTKYVITGSINTPVGRTVNILTVWIIDIGEDSPRFVTAYPFSISKDGLQP